MQDLGIVFGQARQHSAAPTSEETSWFSSAISVSAAATSRPSPFPAGEGETHEIGPEHPVIQREPFSGCTGPSIRRPVQWRGQPRPGHHPPVAPEPGAPVTSYNARNSPSQQVNRISSPFSGR
jgi:hypothetical protein